MDVEHPQTCQTQSAVSQVHDWVVYKLRLFGSVGPKVQIHKITSGTGKERGDIEIKEYIVLEKLKTPTSGQPTYSSRTLIMDVTMTHVRFD